MGHSSKYAQFEASQVFLDCKRTISEQKALLKNIVPYEKTHERYGAARRERLRYVGRIDLAEQTMSRTEKALNNYPKKYHFVRIPMKSNSCPTLQEILPTVWELERLYREGHNIFIYSREGHGRCGILGAALLGRLYGLTAYDTQYRIQACHDVTPNFFSNETKVNCPQLWQQQGLVRELLEQVSSIRSQQTLTAAVLTPVPSPPPLTPPPPHPYAFPAV